MREVNRDAAREHSIAVQPAGGRYAVPPIDGAVTVADAISVDDDLIFNLLVDQAQIERVIITETEEECERTWISLDNRMERFRHPNISQAVAKDGTLIVIRNGNRSSQSNTNRNQYEPYFVHFVVAFDFENDLTTTLRWQAPWSRCERSGGGDASADAGRAAPGKGSARRARGGVKNTATAGPGSQAAAGEHRPNARISEESRQQHAANLAGA
jgi:hypothetical protein